MGVGAGVADGASEVVGNLLVSYVLFVLYVLSSWGRWQAGA